MVVFLSVSNLATMGFAMAGLLYFGSMESGDPT